jgi:tetratricopeptide (TPR) repeat protein
MSSNRLAPLALALALSGAAGCAGPAAPPPRAPAKADAIGTAPQIVTRDRVGTPTELFEEARSLFLEGKHREAGERFDLVWQGDPNGPLAARAALQAGLSYQEAGELDTAQQRFSLLPERYPKEPLVKPALLYKSRIFVALERWAELGQNAEALLARADLSVLEAVEAHGARALSLVSLGQVDKAARPLEQARNLIERNHLGESGAAPYEITIVSYALGEIRRAQGELIKFEPPPPNFGEAFERRAQLVLDAQSAYADAMRTKDPAWATMAGYRVGQLYRALHRDVMAARFPTNVAKTPRDQQLFEGAMRVRYRVLLRKGLAMLDSTVRMNERVGLQGVWGDRAKEAKAELERSLEAENQAIAKMPVPEAELQKQLDLLQEKREKQKGG